MCNPAILHKSHEYINDFNFYFFIDLIHFGGNSFKILHLHHAGLILCLSSLHYICMLQLHNTRNIPSNVSLWLIHIIKTNKSEHKKYFIMGKRVVLMDFAAQEKKMKAHELEKKMRRHKN